jgi:hypothetical protein
MQSTSVLRALLVLMTFTLASAGCVGDGETATSEDLAQQQGAVLGVDEFLYFRSNATGWGVDDATRLVPFAGIANVFSRLYNLADAWIVAGSDTAIVTRTNQLNGWGTSQTFYGPASKLVVVPGTAPLVAQAPGGDAHFAVDYAVLGQHRVIANFAASPPTIQIQSRADACAGVCPPSLTCVLSPPAGIPTCVEPPPTGP